MRPHPRRAVQNALLQRLAGAAADVLHGEELLHRRDPLHLVRLAPDLRRAAVDDPRLVEMDVSLDEAGAGEPTAGFENLGIGRETASNGGDAAALDADIDRLLSRLPAEAHIANDEVHARPLLPCRSPRSDATSPADRRRGKPVETDDGPDPSPDPCSTAHGPAASLFSVRALHG